MLDHVDKVSCNALQVALLQVCKACGELFLFLGIQSLQGHAQDVFHVMQAEALALLEGFAELEVLAPEIGNGEAVAVEAVLHPLADQTALLAFGKGVVQTDKSLLEVMGILHLPECLGDALAGAFQMGLPEDGH